MVASKIVRLQTFTSHSVVPKSSSMVIDCDKVFTTSLNGDKQSKIIDRITPKNTQKLIGSDIARKHKGFIELDMLFINMAIALIC